MPQRDARMYLADMLESADRIVRLTSGMTLDDYRADERARLAVERCFEIIGEAMRRVIELEPTIGDRVTDARRVVDFRNLLIHAYHVIDDRVVWDIVVQDLPRLRAQIDALLRDRGGEMPS